jgi:hypothetical protein
MANEPYSLLFISTIALSKEERQQLLKLLRSCKPSGTHGDNLVQHARRYSCSNSFL